MTWVMLAGLCLPFLGTALGAAGVFFCKKGLGTGANVALNGAAAGIMTAASVWSLLLPAIDRAGGGMTGILPVLGGFWTGVLLFLLIDRFVPADGGAGEGKPKLTVLAVTLHNLPEGVAVGVLLAGYLAHIPSIGALAVLSLSLGVAAQNIPEGAIVSLPLRSMGKSKPRAFTGGVLSGAVEPIGALLALLTAEAAVAALPFLLSFAAGAMICVTVQELLPTLQADGTGRRGTLFFSLGFSVMMLLDVVLG